MFNAIVKSDSLPVLTGYNILLRSPDMADFEAWKILREESRVFLTPWEPVWTSYELTRPAFRSRLKRYSRELADSVAFHFFIFSADGKTLLGGINLNNIRRGVTQSCSMGYWTGERHAGKGVMTDAVRTIIPFVFDTAKLNRLEAACVPENDRSRFLLEHLGFTQEGFARDYLMINGRLQDHLLFAMTKADYAGGFQTVLQRELGAQAGSGKPGFA